MTRTNGYWAAALALLAASLAASALLYPVMPDRVPIHWNLQGQVDGYGSKLVGLFLLPGMMAGMLVMFWFLPALSPKNFEVDAFQSTYLYVMLIIMGLFAYIHAVTLTASWQEGAPGPKLDMGRVLIGGMFLFFGLLGNVMGKVRKNFYIGVRTPWTLASDRVWNDTHRLAAWLMVAGSVLGFLIVVSGQSLVAAIGVLLASTLYPVVYSFLHYRRLERRGEL